MSRALRGHHLAVAAVLFAAVALVRLPFATTHLWAWDSVLYARALELGFHVDVDPSLSRPHPPGYIWYVGLAQVARAALADSNAALVLLSILGGAAGAAILWLVARRWMRAEIALVLALAYAASPVVWAYSEVAYPYTVLGLVSLVLGALFVSGRHPLAASLAFGLLAGARQDVLLLLAPLWLWSLRRRDARTLAASAGLAVAGVLAWWIPSAALSGGPGGYLAALTRQGGFVANTYSVPANGLSALAYNVGFTLEAAGWGLGLFAVPFAVALARTLRARRRLALGTVGTGLVLWAAPPILFYAFVHIGEWGYVLSILPPLFLAAGVLVDRIASADLSPRWIAAGAAAVVLPAAVFLSGDVAYAEVAGGARFSASALARHDMALAAQVAYVRARFSPETTVVLARDDFQLVRYYLPEYRAWYWDPDPYAPSSAKRKRAMRPTTIVVFTAGLQPLRSGEIRRVEVAPGVDLAYLPLDRGSVLELQGERYVVREAPGR